MQLIHGCHVINLKNHHIISKERTTDTGKKGGKYILNLTKFSYSQVQLHLQKKNIAPLILLSSES